MNIYRMVVLLFRNLVAMDSGRRVEQSNCVGMGTLHLALTIRPKATLVAMIAGTGLARTTFLRASMLTARFPALLCN